MGLGTHSHPTDNSFWSDTSVGLLHCISAEGNTFGLFYEAEFAATCLHSHKK